MKIEGIGFDVTDWSAVAPEEHKGETGTSYWRVYSQGNVRARIVDYSPGFRSDHWCGRGHVLLVLEGRLSIELEDGSVHDLGPGMSFQAGDDESKRHLAHTAEGAKVFLVD